MTQSDAEARQELLDALAEAADRLGFALAALGAAYDEVDEQTADRLEEELFQPRCRRPTAALGARTRRSPERHDLPAHDFVAGSPGVASIGPRGRIDAAVDAVRAADLELSELQDSMLPVEYGDAELARRPGRDAGARGGAAETGRGSWFASSGR